MQIQTSTETQAVYSTDRHKDELVELVDKISTCARDAIESSNDALQSAITAGGYLTKAKDRVFRGKWGPWLRDNFKFGQNTASNWMRLYKHRKEILELAEDSQECMSVEKALKLVGANPGRRELTKYQLVQKRSRDFIREIYNQTPTDEKKTRQLIIDHQMEITTYLKSHGK